MSITFFCNLNTRQILHIEESEQKMQNSASNIESRRKCFSPGCDVTSFYEISCITLLIWNKFCPLECRLRVAAWKRFSLSGPTIPLRGGGGIKAEPLRKKNWKKPFFPLIDNDRYSNQDLRTSIIIKLKYVVGWRSRSFY